MAFTTWSTTDKSASVTLTGGNLIATSGATQQSVRGAHPKRAGKYYFEITCNTVSNNNFGVGIATFGQSLTPGAGTNPTNACAVYRGGGFYIDNSLGASGLNLVSGNLVCIAVDLDRGLIWARVGAAGNWNAGASNNPATGVGGLSVVPAVMGPGIDVYPFATFGANTEQATLNAGATAFSGTVPSGFTSGWDDSVAALSNVVATQVGTEVWASNPSVAMQLTQLGIEVWVPATSYTTDSYSGLIRETLLATNGQANVSGLVREVLRSTGSSGVTFAAYSGLVREVLLASGGAAPVTTTQARAIILA